MDDTIIFTGPIGGGKSTQAQLLGKELGHPVCVYTVYTLNKTPDEVHRDILCKLDKLGKFNKLDAWSSDNKFIRRLAIR